jgi:hypothetical protein
LSRDRSVSRLGDSNGYTDNRQPRTVRGNPSIVPVPPWRGHRSICTAAALLLLLPAWHCLASLPWCATFPLPGQTEAGSAGEQPDRGITRPTVRQWCISIWPPAHVGGPGALLAPIGHQSYASENASVPSPLETLPSPRSPGFHTNLPSVYYRGTFLRRPLFSLTLRLCRLCRLGGPDQPLPELPPPDLKGFRQG